MPAGSVTMVDAYNTTDISSWNDGEVVGVENSFSIHFNGSQKTLMDALNNWINVKFKFWNLYDDSVYSNAVTLAWTSEVKTEP